MKKIYTLLSVSIICISANAQTLMQSNHAMNIGDMYSTKQCDSTGITPGGNGAAQTWNYSTLNIWQSTVKNYTAVSVASTGSASAYPSAGVAVSGGSNDNSFYSSNSTDYKYWGGNINVGGNAVVLNYTNSFAVARYPMSLANSTVSSISGTLSAFSNTGNFGGTATVTATGTGQLDLPGISFPNVIKVVSAQTLTFTIIVPGSLTQITYDYYSPSGSKAPLFTIATSTLASGLGTSTQTFVTINSNFLVLGVKEKNDAQTLNLEVYPNPSHESITLSYENPNGQDVNVDFINVSGQLMKSEKINSTSGFNKQQINLNGLSSGMYFVTLKVGDKVTVKKITID